MGCVESSAGPSNNGVAAVGAAGTATRSPPEFKLAANDLVTKPTEKFLLMQHHMEAGSNYYYLKAIKTSWAELAAGPKTRTTLTLPGSRTANKIGSTKASVTTSALAASESIALHADVAGDSSAAAAAGKGATSEAAATVAAQQAGEGATSLDVAASAASSADSVDATDAGAPSDTAGTVEASDTAAAPAEDLVGKHHHLRKLLQIRDNRFQITNTQAFPYWNIGQLFFQTRTGGSRCSGTFMSPDDIITAGHCVIDSATGATYNGFQFAPAKNGATEPYGR